MKVRMEGERESQVPLVVIRFVLAYLRREVVRCTNACAGQLNSAVQTNQDAL